MPLVRVDMNKGKSAGYRNALADAIYDAMVATLNVPQNDRFIVIDEHDDGQLQIDKTYLGIERTDACIVIQVTLNTGRSVEMKKAFYQAVADNIHQRTGLRKEDVFINLVEVVKENWSFGNGIAQYA
jgi:phenylpyruvate tautomerase PptA (4-oxalocrotonate tautomerase family)